MVPSVIVLKEELCLELKENLQDLITSAVCNHSLSAGEFVRAKKNLFHQYFQTLFNQFLEDPSILFKRELPFPQKVPRLDYFREICLFHKIEETYLENLQNSIMTLLNHLGSRTIKSEEDGNLLINTLNIALRLGVPRLEISNLVFDIPEGLLKKRVELLQTISRINHIASLDENIEEKDILSLVGMFEKACKENREECLFAAVIGNRAIVTYRRYGEKSQELEMAIQELANKVCVLIQDIEPSSFIETISMSMICRGVPMGLPKGDIRQGELIEKSRLCLESLRPVGDLEELVKTELDFTLSLTEYKVAKFSEQPVEEKLDRIVALDPANSEPWAEKGLWHFEKEDYESAQSAFQNAVELGPPNRAMSAYYLAHCYKHKNKELYIGWLRKCVEFDDLAISPLLDLIEVEGFEESCRIKQKVLENEFLRQQLTEEELCSLN